MGTRMAELGDHDSVRGTILSNTNWVCFQVPRSCFQCPLRPSTQKIPPLLCFSQRRTSVEGERHWGLTSDSSIKICIQQQQNKCRNKHQLLDISGSQVPGLVLTLKRYVISDESLSISKHTSPLLENGGLGYKPIL